MRTESLTPRQREIVELKSKGLTYREIAERLGVQTQSIKNQAFWATSRTGANNMTELCVWYAQELETGT